MSAEASIESGGLGEFKRVWKQGKFTGRFGSLRFLVILMRILVAVCIAGGLVATFMTWEKAGFLEGLGMLLLCLSGIIPLSVFADSILLLLAMEGYAQQSLACLEKIYEVLELGAFQQNSQKVNP